MLHSLKYLLCCLCITLLSSCSTPPESENQLKVGTVAGPETTLMEIARDIMKEQHGIDVKIVEFNDYSMPNIALADGSIDANVFQHQPYLDAVIKARGYQLISIGKTFLYPMGVYSKKINRLEDLPAGAVVVIPNDPSNEARALLLLEKAGLITLKTPDKRLVTVLSIAENPKQLQFKTLDSAQLPRVLPDVHLAVINSNFAIPAQLLPTRDAVFLEDKESPYANIIVVRRADVNRPALKKLVLALQADPVLNKAKELFAGQAISAW